jgi:hypothetical protein
MTPEPESDLDLERTGQPRVVVKPAHAPCAACLRGSYVVLFDRVLVVYCRHWGVGGYCVIGPDLEGGSWTFIGPMDEPKWVDVLNASVIETLRIFGVVLAPGTRLLTGDWIAPGEKKLARGNPFA